MFTFSRSAKIIDFLPPFLPLSHSLNMELDLQSLYLGSMHTALYSTHCRKPRNTPPPPRHAFGLIWSYWSAKIDDIALWPPAFSSSSKRLPSSVTPSRECTSNSLIMKPWVLGNAIFAAIRGSLWSAEQIDSLITKKDRLFFRSGDHFTMSYMAGHRLVPSDPLAH